MATDNQAETFVDTKFGKCPVGSIASYQLAFTESNFAAHAELGALAQRPEPIAVDKYPRFPLVEEELMNIPETLSTKEQEVISVLKLDENEINNIEINTRKQSDCDEWKKQRTHRFTASNFHLISHRKRNHDTLATNLMHPKQWTNRSVEHGKNFEPVALMEYQKYMKSIRRPVTVLPSGFVVSKSHPVLGASPDGKVIDPHCVDCFGLAEVKCPYKMANVTPLDACSDETFCMHKTGNNTCSLKTNHVYYAQVQGQMGVTGATWCDFIVYTRRGIYVQRVAFDPNFWSNLREKLTTYYFDHFIKYAVEDLSTQSNNDTGNNDTGNNDK
jgi:hypothetical protein